MVPADDCDQAFGPAPSTPTTTIPKLQNPIQLVFRFMASVITGREYAPKKVYAVNTGLANRVSLSFSHNLGALTENMVFLELLRRGADVSYYRTASGREVDFACRRGRALAELVQVTLSLADRQVRTREVAAMTEAMDEQKLDVGLVLTESDRQDIVSGRRTIKVRPLAGWLCGLDG